MLGTSMLATTMLATGNSANAVVVVSISDSAATADALTDVTIYARALPENAATADALVTSTVHHRALAELAQTLDTLNAPQLRSLAETAFTDDEIFYVLVRAFQALAFGQAVERFRFGQAVERWAFGRSRPAARVGQSVTP